MTAFDDQAAELLHRLNAGAPQITQTLIEAARMEALASVISGSIALIVFGILLRLTLKRVQPWAFAGDRDLIDEPGREICLVLMWCAVGILGLIASIALLDPWTYITLAKPELWVAHQFMATRP